jgi:hypothetical protein
VVGVSKKKPQTEREARLQQLRAQQQGSERRRRGLIIGGAAAVVLVLVAAVAVTVVREVRANDPANIGLTAAAAACGPVQEVAVAGVAEHVGPGTSSPDTTTVDYDTVPAVSGPHHVSPAYPASSFYTGEDRPEIETLVHNLEHGYTIAWYTEALPEEQLTALQDASEAMRDLDETQSGKFIAAPWDEARGEFPDGQGLALAHWGADRGALQYCGGVSGETITSFVEAHPANDSPEPNAA